MIDGFFSEYRKRQYKIIELFNENFVAMVLHAVEYDTNQDSFEYMVPLFSKSKTSDDRWS